jgi:hypothetical protein
MHIVVSCRQRIGSQSVGEHLGAGFHIAQEEGAQCVSFSIGDDLNAATTEPFGLNLLDGHSNQHLARSASPSLSSASTTQHRFIDFHIARKSRALGVPNGATKSVQHRPSRFVGAKPHETVERLGRNPVLRRRHMPGRRKPYSEGRFRAMKDCAGRCRNPPTTIFAPPSAIIHAPSCIASTVRTGKSVRPTQPVQVIKTSGIIRKPAEKISIVPWDSPSQIVARASIQLSPSEHASIAALFRIPNLFYLAPRLGLEPRTYGLTVRRSTD